MYFGVGGGVGVGGGDMIQNIAVLSVSAGNRAGVFHALCALSYKHQIWHNWRPICWIIKDMELSEKSRLIIMTAILNFNQFHPLSTKNTKKI